MDISERGVPAQASHSWTPEEDCIIRDRWTEMSVAELAELLGVDVPAVQARLRRLGIRRVGRPPLWTPREDEAVRTRFASEGASVLARELGRTETAVRIRAGRLGLKTRQRRVWRREEVMRLRDMLLKGATVADASRTLCRNPASVQLKARKLGLRGVRHVEAWSSTQLELLRSCVAQGVPMAEISARLGRTQGACRQKACRLGLLPRARRSCVAPSDDAQGGAQ